MGVIWLYNLNIRNTAGCPVHPEFQRNLKGDLILNCDFDSRVLIKVYSSWRNSGEKKVKIVGE